MHSEPRFDETVLFESSLVRIGAFRCDADHAAFPRSAPIANHCVWFARTPVAIQPEHEKRFVANPNTAVFYNRAASFARTRIGVRGDQSDWFGIDETLACQIVEARAPGRGRRDAGPFPWHRVAVDSATYLAQRQLFEAAARSSASPLTLEEGVIRLVERSLASAPS
jgi:hypothetical protein